MKKGKETGTMYIFGLVNIRAEPNIKKQDQ